MRLVLPALLAAFALAAPAGAHVGRPVLPDAIAALQSGQLYVDYDAKPSLTRLEAGRLEGFLPSGVRVAVLPSKVRNEVNGDVARTLASEVGRSGAYLVVVGGELSTVDAPAAAKETFDARRSDGLAPAVEAAADAAAPPSRSSNWPAFLVSTLLGFVALAVLAWRARRQSGASY